MKLAHLDGRPARDGSLAAPRQRLVQISGFQHPKTTYVLLGLHVRPVGDEYLTTGLRPQRLRAFYRVQTAMPPAQVADAVFQAIREERFYILTHPEGKDWIRTRMEDILQERNPISLAL